MLSETEIWRAAACASRVSEVAAISLDDLAGTPLRLGERSARDARNLDDALLWLHAATRERVLAALIDARVIRYDGMAVTVDSALAGTVTTGLWTLPYSARKGATFAPVVYLSPPDILADILKDVGDIRQLIIDLMSVTTCHLNILTSFFSKSALFDILAPLDVSPTRPQLRLYFSIMLHERQRVEQLRKVIVFRFSQHALSNYQHRRPAHDTSALPHAKFVLRDSTVGCLGSATVTRPGLQEKFEARVRLNQRAVVALESALDALVRRAQ